MKRNQSCAKRNYQVDNPCHYTSPHLQLYQTYSFPCLISATPQEFCLNREVFRLIIKIIDPFSTFGERSKVYFQYASRPVRGETSGRNWSMPQPPKAVCLYVNKQLSLFIYINKCLQLGLADRGRVISYLLLIYVCLKDKLGPLSNAVFSRQRLSRRQGITTPQFTGRGSRRGRLKWVLTSIDLIP